VDVLVDAVVDGVVDAPRHHECSPEPVPVWAEAGTTATASITIIRVTTPNNTNMCLFMCYAFRKGRADQPRQLANPVCKFR